MSDARTTSTAVVLTCMGLAASACSTCTAGRRLRSWGPVSSATHATMTCSEAQRDGQAPPQTQQDFGVEPRNKSGPRDLETTLHDAHSHVVAGHPQTYPVCGCCCGRQLFQPVWVADESCQAACCCVGRARVMVGALNQRQQAG